MPDRPLIIDSFAGGGGASLGIELALGRGPDIAVNHDAEAVALHAANHPATRHLCQSVYRVDPRELVDGRPVGLLWASPDCTHFSKAKGGRPRSKGVRDLAWVVVEWAAAVAPDVICLENVEEFRTWGPLDWQGQPVPELAGKTWDRWCFALRRLGYRLEWRELRACDYGAPTIRKRLFVVARRDGRPIVWPEPSHGAPDSPEVLSGHLSPWRTAAEIIDWSEPVCSIFATRDEAREWGRLHGRPSPKRPLADATLRRVAHGLVRYVLEAERPYLVDAGGPVVPTLVQTGYGERAGQAPRVPGLDQPLGTVVAGGAKHALVTAFVNTHYGRTFDSPLGTVTTVDHHSVAAVHLSHAYTSNTNGGEGSPDTPLKTITAGGNHHYLVASFLQSYYGAGQQGQRADGPLRTVTTADRHGLVTVAIDGRSYVVADIGLRMLTPRELYRAQGFPDNYRIDVDFSGRPLTKKAQVRMCGNSVCPPMAAALVEVNCGHLAVEEGVRYA